MSWGTPCISSIIKYTWYRPDISKCSLIVIKLNIDMCRSVIKFIFSSNNISLVFLVKIIKAKETHRRLVNDTWRYSVLLHR